MNLTSPAFTKAMPATYTCQGRDISPPLEISGIPDAAKSLVLIMDDPDAPDPAAPKMTWDHWIVWNIPATTRTIPEGTTPHGAIVGQNSWPKNSYGGPCPPIGEHRYFFRLYAIDAMLHLPATADKKSVLAAIAGHVLATAELVGTYKKH